MSSNLQTPIHTLQQHGNRLYLEVSNASQDMSTALSVTPGTCVDFVKQVARVERRRMDKEQTENHCTAQVFASWGVALPPGCGHCPAHSNFCREQRYAAQTASAFFVFDTKQERILSPQRVTVIALAHKGGDEVKKENCTFPSATEASVSSGLMHHSTNLWMLWLRDTRDN